jgi:hypothetical protein
MTNDEMVAELDSAMRSITTVRQELAGAQPPGTVVNVPAGSSLQAAVDAAAPGTTLVLEDGVFTQGKLRVAKQRVTLTCKNPPPPGRATENAPVTIHGNADAAVEVGEGTDVTFVGVGFANDNADGDLVNVTIPAKNTTFDRITGLGDPAHGQRRAIRLHGTGIRVLKSHCDHIFAFGRDTCVLGGWDGGRDIVIDDCYLCGGAETIMFGGGDSASADRIPQNIEITNSVLTKRREWYDMGVQIKNAFELKSALNVHMADCLLEYAGISEGQGAYLILVTPRNQDGNAPWSTVKHVLIERVHGRIGGGGLLILGTDNNHPSDPIDDITFRNVAFTDLDPQGVTGGTGRGVCFDHAPHGVTLDAITVDGKNMGSLGYFPNTPTQPTALTLTNWKYCSTKYGWKIDNGGLDMPPASKNIKALMPDLVYNVTANDPGAVGYPTARHGHGQHHRREGKHHGADQAEPL